jgi:hypothetical protein
MYPGVDSLPYGLLGSCIRDAVHGGDGVGGGRGFGCFLRLGAATGDHLVHLSDWRGSSNGGVPAVAGGRETGSGRGAPGLGADQDSAGRGAGGGGLGAPAMPAVAAAADACPATPRAGSGSHGTSRGVIDRARRS